MNASAGGAPSALSYGTASSQMQIQGGAYLTAMDDVAPPSTGRTASATVVGLNGWGAVIATVPLTPTLLPQQMKRRFPAQWTRITQPASGAVYTR
jgi:hypothetical protein